VLKGLPADLPRRWWLVQQDVGGQGSLLVPILRTRTGNEIDWAADGAVLVVRLCFRSLR
jgi:hypothetical protein